MTTLLNTFEGGSQGTAITQGSGGNSGGASGNFFDVVTIGASATAAFDNTHAAHGTLAAKIATGASSVTSTVGWSTSFGSHAQAWYRFAMYLTANPAANQRVWTSTLTGTTCGGVNLLTTGQLRVVNTAASAVTTSTATVPLNTWFRVEGFFVFSASVGQSELKLFPTADATVPTETDTSAATQNFDGTADTYRWGIATAAASTGPFWVDDLGLSSTGYIGPVVTGTAKRAPSIVPSLVAAGVI